MDVFAVVGFGEHLPVLRVARDHARQREQADHDRHQQADHQAENVEEMGILLAHDVIRSGRADLAAEYSRSTPRLVNRVVAQTHYPISCADKLVWDTANPPAFVAREFLSVT